jgi:hypothetical protein
MVLEGQPWEDIVGFWDMMTALAVFLEDKDIRRESWSFVQRDIRKPKYSFWRRTKSICTLLELNT